MSKKRQGLWLLAGVLICLLPFIRRPFFFDDSSVVATAEAARQHPLDPYNYRLDLAYPDTVNWPAGSLPAYTHPPFSAWLLAPWTSWQKEWPLHGIMFIVAMIGLWAAGRVSGFFSDQPIKAVALVAFSPAFFLTSLTLYPHLIYFAFAMGALYFTLRIAQRGSWPAAFALGLCLLLAALSLHSWPLLLILCAGASFYPTKPSAGRWSLGAVAILIFMLGYGAWCLWEKRLYGMPHFLATYQVRAALGGPYPWSAAILPLTFIAGSAPFLAIGWLDLKRTSRPLLGILLAAALGLAFFFNSSQGGFSAVQSVILSGLFTTGLAFIAALLLRLRRATRTERFLIAWFLIEVLFVQKYLVYPSAHHLLMLLVPGALLTITMAERAGVRPKALQAGMILLAVFTLVLAQADAGEAGSGPWIARTAERGPGGNYYWGNCFSGFTYYLNRAGWRAFDLRVRPRPGDRILIPQNLNSQGSTSPLRQWPSHGLAMYPYYQHNPFRTYSLADSAGWYSASWGALPFSLSSRPVENFILVEFQ